MSKTAREVLAEQIIGPSPGTLIDDAEAEGIIAALDAAGFVIRPKEPTRTMVEAGIRAAVAERDHLADEGVPEIYRAMIAEASQES